jgi:hypothetical protein
MISKNRAIDILDKYLYYHYNVDPLESIEVKAHRLYVKEYDLYWNLIMSSVHNYDKLIDGPSEWVGGGTFFIGKEHGLIYPIGSSPWYDWHEEYKKFRNGIGSELKWTPLTNEYLKCETINCRVVQHDLHLLECQYSEENTKLENFFRSKIKRNSENNYPIFKRVAFATDTGNIPVAVRGQLQEDYIRVVVMNFNGGLSGYSLALRAIKKYCRVNRLKYSDEFHANILETDLSKPFDDWNCQLEMTISGGSN